MIEDFLRENKPQVKEDPTFILETRSRLDAVEGIKAEVDRQRHWGRLALIIALASGLVLGVLVTAVAYLYPVDAQSVEEGLIHSFRLFLASYREYLLLPVAILAIGLGFVLSRNTRAVQL